MKIIILLSVMILFTACGGQPTLADDEQPPIEHEIITDEAAEFAERLAALEPFGTRTEIISRFYNETTYELIPRDDYGRLYPFGYRGFYGFMTESGAIVVDAVFEAVHFIDIDDGYYRAGRFTGDDWQREFTVIAADGSSAITTLGFPVLLGGGRVRVFVNSFNGDYWEEHIGVLGMDGNIIEPFINTEENYIKFMVNAGMEQSYAFYANKSTGEAFTDIQWLPFEGVIELTGSEHPIMNATEEMRVLYGETPRTDYGLFPTDSGFHEATENNYTGVKNADGEWLIKIDLLKYND
jgi:hypothetical protein